MHDSQTPPQEPVRPLAEVAPESGPLDVSRRGFLKGAGLTVATVGLAQTGALAQTAASGEEVTVVGPGAVKMLLQVNGKQHEVQAPPSATLSEVLRDQLGLTGSKRGCDRGACGSCSVIVGDRVLNSCSTLAIDATGKSIVTVENLASGDHLTALQQAFVDHDALQCGFCTPGMLMACTALLKRNPHPSRAEIADALAGNLCRCGCYPNIFKAVEQAAKKGGR